VNADRLVSEYLDRLESELADVPRARRRELVAELSEHMDAFRAAHPEATDADVLNALDRLGDPAEIAAEERERLGLRPTKAGAKEIAALVLLPVGGVILPLVGWVLGVFFFWLSDAWSNRDKLLGTLILPGGLALPLFFFFAGTYAEECSGQLDPATGATIPGTMVCTGGPSTLAQVLGGILLVAAIVAPLAMVVYLARRMRRPAAVA
jgi:hypothetical protein